jgi:ribosomal protein L20
VLLHIEREKDQPVTSEEMRTVVMATLTLIGKVARIPDMTAVYQKMTIIRTELSQNANGTATEIQNIKDELKSLTAGVQKGITTGEAAAAAAKEAAEVSKTVAGMARDIKNRSTQHQTGAPISYAAVAAHGALAASTYNTQNVYTAPAPVQREIIVNIRNAQTIQTLRAMNPRTMKTHVDNAIAQSENEHVSKITTMSANQLKSGDLSIRTATNSEMQMLRQFTDDWVHRIGDGTSVRTHTYGVLVHGIRTRTMNIERFEEVRAEILQANKAFLPTADIKYIGWLTRKRPDKTMSSIVIEFTKPEDANKIIKEGLVWEGEMCQSERYERKCRLKQYFQCQKYGHIGTQCKAAKTCGYCALEHNSSDCPTKANRDTTKKCAVCHGAHEAWNQECPIRIEELAKVKAALASRPKYHAIAAMDNEADQGGLERMPPRRSRSTRDLALQSDHRTNRPSSTQGRGQKRSAPVGDKENEPPSASQRPQRAAIPSRRALEALAVNALRQGNTQMDIDTDTDL